MWLVKVEGQVYITLKYQAADTEDQIAILDGRIFDPSAEEEWKRAGEQWLGNRSN